MFAGVRTALLSGVVKEVKEEILTFSKECAINKIETDSFSGGGTVAQEIKDLGGQIPRRHQQSDFQCVQGPG